MMIDAGASVTDQDAKLARLIHDKGRAVVMLLNKWDAIEGKTNATLGEHVRSLQESLGFIAYAPILTISGLTGQRTHKILDQVDQVLENWNRRVSTSEYLELWIQAQPPKRSTIVELRAIGALDSSRNAISRDGGGVAHNV